MLPYTPMRKRHYTSDSPRPPVSLVPGVGTSVLWDPTDIVQVEPTASNNSTINKIKPGGYNDGDSEKVISGNMSTFESSVVNFHVRHGWLYTLSMLSRSMITDHHDNKRGATKGATHGKDSANKSYNIRTYSALFRHIEPSAPARAHDAVLCEYTVDIQRSVAGLEEVYHPTIDGIHPPTVGERRILEAEIDGVRDINTVGSGNGSPVTQISLSDNIASGNGDVTSLAMNRAVTLLHDRHVVRDKSTAKVEEYSLQEIAEILMDAFTCVALDKHNHHLYYCGNRRHDKDNDLPTGHPSIGNVDNVISNSEVVSPLCHLLKLLQSSGIFMICRQYGSDSDNTTDNIGIMELILLPLLGPRRWHILSRIFIPHIYASTAQRNETGISNKSVSASVTAVKRPSVSQSLHRGSLSHMHALVAIGTIMGIFYTADSCRRLFSDVFIPNWLSEVVDYTLYCNGDNKHSIRSLTTSLGFIRTALAKTVVGMTAFCALFHTNDRQDCVIPSVMLQLSLSGLFDVGRAAAGEHAISNVPDKALISPPDSIKDRSDDDSIAYLNSVFQSRRSFSMTMIVAFQQLMFDLLIVHNPIFSLGRQRVIVFGNGCPLKNCRQTLKCDIHHDSDQNTCADSRRERKRARADEKTISKYTSSSSAALKTSQTVAISPMEYDMCISQLFPIVLQQNGFEFPWEAYRRDWRRIFRYYRKQQHDGNDNNHSSHTRTVLSAQLLSTQMLDDFHRILIKGFTGGASGNRYTYPGRLSALMFPGNGDSDNDDEDINASSSNVVNDAISQGIKNVLDSLEQYSSRGKAAQASHHEAVEAYLSLQQGVGFSASSRTHMDLNLNTSTTWYVTPFALEAAVKEAIIVLVREGGRAHPLALSGKASDVVNEINTLQICLEISVSKLVSEQAQEAHKARLTTLALLLAVLRLSQLAYRDEVSTYLLPVQPPLVSAVNARRSNGGGHLPRGRPIKGPISDTAPVFDEDEIIHLDSSRFSMGGNVYAAVRSLMTNTPQYRSLRVTKGTAIYNAVSSKCAYLCQGGFPLAQYVFPQTLSSSTIDVSRHIGESCYTPFSQLVTTLFHIPLVTDEGTSGGIVTDSQRRQTVDGQYPLLGASSHDSLTSPLCLSMELFIEKMVLRVLLAEHAAYFESYTDVVGVGTASPLLFPYCLSSADGRVNPLIPGLCDSLFADAYYDMSSRGLGMITHPGDIIVCLLIYSERMGLWERALEDTITALSSDVDVVAMEYYGTEEEESVKNKAREENRWLISVLQKMRQENKMNNITTGVDDESLHSTTATYFKSIYLNPVVVNSPFRGAFMRSMLWQVTEGLANSVHTTMDQLGSDDHQQLPAALKVHCTGWVALLHIFGLVNPSNKWSNSSFEGRNGEQHRNITEALGGFSCDLHRHFGQFIDQFSKQ